LHEVVGERIVIIKDEDHNFIVASKSSRNIGSTSAQLFFLNSKLRYIICPT
jgi:hypothetical protein